MGGFVLLEEVAGIIEEATAQYQATLSGLTGYEVGTMEYEIADIMVKEFSDEQRKKLSEWIFGDDSEENMEKIHKFRKSDWERELQKKDQEYAKLQQEGKEWSEEHERALARLKQSKRMIKEANAAYLKKKTEAYNKWLAEKPSEERVRLLKMDTIAQEREFYREHTDRDGFMRMGEEDIENSDSNNNNDEPMPVRPRDEKPKGPDDAQLKKLKWTLNDNDGDVEERTLAALASKKPLTKSQWKALKNSPRATRMLAAAAENKEIEIGPGGKLETDREGTPYILFDDDDPPTDSHGNWISPEKRQTLKPYPITPPQSPDIKPIPAPPGPPTPPTPGPPSEWHYTPRTPGNVPPGPPPRPRPPMPKPDFSPPGSRGIPSPDQSDRGSTSTWTSIEGVDDLGRQVYSWHGGRVGPGDSNYGLAKARDINRRAGRSRGDEGWVFFDDHGQSIDEEGHRINEAGNWIDEEGNELKVNEGTTAEIKDDENKDADANNTAITSQVQQGVTSKEVENMVKSSIGEAFKSDPVKKEPGDVPDSKPVQVKNDPNPRPYKKTRPPQAVDPPGRPRVESVNAQIPFANFKTSRNTQQTHPVSTPEYETRRYGAYNTTTHKKLTLPNLYSANQHNNPNGDATRAHTDAEWKELWDANDRNAPELHSAANQKTPSTIPNVDNKIDDKIWLFDPDHPYLGYSLDSWGDARGGRDPNDCRVQDYAPGENHPITAPTTRRTAKDVITRGLRTTNNTGLAILAHDNYKKSMQFNNLMY